MSSKTTTPLHSSTQPCSGWLLTTRAASWSLASATGQAGWCVHIVVLLGVGLILFSFVIVVSDVTP